MKLIKARRITARVLNIPFRTLVLSVDFERYGFTRDVNAHINYLAAIYKVYAHATDESTSSESTYP